MIRQCFFRLALLTLPAMAMAQDFPPPSGDIVLTVTGDIGQHNDGDALQFDLQQLDAMPQREIETSTVWGTKKSVFSGVLLKDFIARIQAHGQMMTLTAWNGYQIRMPVSLAADDGPILASHMDGKPISGRDKGPLWVIFPYDQNSEYKTEYIYAMSIWQLDSMEFTD